MEAQKNWLEFFERSERQREARQRLIRELPTDQRVKDLLVALSDLAETDPSALTLSNGDVELSVPIGVIAWRLKRCENTAKRYIDLAELTPYLKVSGSTHRSHTYVVCWLAILDRIEPGHDTHAGGCQHVENETAGGRRRGSVSRGSGGQLDPAEGVKWGSGGGQPGGQTDPHLTPSIPGIKDRVFYGIGSKKPGSKPGVGGPPGGQLTIRGDIPVGPPQIVGRKPNNDPIWNAGTGDWWKWWRGQLERRDLANPQHVQELYELGVASGLYPESEAHRLRIFAQAVVDVRKAKHVPKAFFRENVAFRRWYATDEIEDEAQRIMDAFDAGDVVKARAELPQPYEVAADAADPEEMTRVRIIEQQRLETEGLEAEYGELLDSMSQAELLEIAGDTETLRYAISKGMLGYIRPNLLRMLAEAETANQR